MISRLDNTLIFAALLLSAIGIVIVYSTSSQLAFGGSDMLVRQLLYLFLGMLAFMVALYVPLRWYENLYPFALLMALVLAVVVLYTDLGKTAGGGRRWLDFGFFTLQVSEWIRLLLLIYLAGYLASNQRAIEKNAWEAMKPLLWIVLVCVLVYLEPDFGSVVIVLASSLILLYIHRVPLRHLVIIGCLGLIGLAAVLVVEPYRIGRIQSFLDPWVEQFSGGYQLTQSLISFGYGEWLGVGLGAGVQKLDYLPSAHNDFVFAVFVEELGFIGGVLLLVLMSLLIYRCYVAGATATKQGDTFASLVAYGCGVLFAVQTMINIGVATGLIPTKGLTLPFISYGGNSLLMSAIMIGIVSRVWLELNPSESGNH